MIRGGIVSDSGRWGKDERAEREKSGRRLGTGGRNGGTRLSPRPERAISGYRSGASAEEGNRSGSFRTEGAPARTGS